MHTFFITCEHIDRPRPKNSRLGCFCIAYAICTGFRIHIVAPTKQKRHPDGCLFLLGGSGWIRTTEVSDNRFTVCPLWPLGNAPILN